MTTERQRFVVLWWSSHTLVTRGDGDFTTWLNAKAPVGYRLAGTVEHQPWTGRPEMPRRLECIFERTE